MKEEATMNTKNPRKKPWQTSPNLTVLNLFATITVDSGHVSYRPYQNTTTK